MLWDATTDVGKLPVIIDLARKATALRPCVPNNWEALARLLLRTGKDEEAIAVLTEAVSKLPTEPRLHLVLADAYFQAGRLDRFHEVLDRAPAVPIGDREMTILRLELLMRTKVAKDAALAAAAALALDPTNAVALKILGGTSRQQGNPGIMIPLCQAALEHEPLHTLARYELAVAFAMLGRSEEARRLIDLDRFVRVTEVSTPEGFANAEAFEAALASEIARNPTLKPDPVGKATKGGLQTADLPHTDDHAIGVVLDLIRSKVDAVETELAGAFEHPFVERRPKRARLRAWAVVVPGDGRQVAHIHPDGWLSGVYYVSAPKGTRYNPRGGCLVLGSLDIKGLGDDPPWGIRDIHSAPGRLVTFPSYIPHATVPTRSDEARICISFDVVPVRPSQVALGRAEK
jgi:hypothetical protein